MNNASTLKEFEFTTKIRGTVTTKRWQFERNAEGLLEAIRIFGAVRLTGFINRFLEKDAYEELQDGTVPLGKEEQK